MKRIWRKILIYIKPYLNWRFLVSYGIIWVPIHIYYLGIILYPLHHNAQLLSICLTIQGIMWFPLCQENLIQIPIALWIEKHLFKDVKTEETLNAMLNEAKHDFNYWLNKFKKIFKRRKDNKHGKQ